MRTGTVLQYISTYHTRNNEIVEQINKLLSENLFLLVLSPFNTNYLPPGINYYYLLSSFQRLLFEHHTLLKLQHSLLASIVIEYQEPSTITTNIHHETHFDTSISNSLCPRIIGGISSFWQFGIDLRRSDPSSQLDVLAVLTI